MRLELDENLHDNKRCPIIVCDLDGTLCSTALRDERFEQMHGGATTVTQMMRDGVYNDPAVIAREQPILAGMDLALSLLRDNRPKKWTGELMVLTARPKELDEMTAAWIDRHLPADFFFLHCAGNNDLKMDYLRALCGLTDRVAFFIDDFRPNCDIAEDELRLNTILFRPSRVRRNPAEVACV